MKINEFKKPVTESITSAFQDLFTGQGAVQTRTQQIFLKDFYQDAITSLNNGIKGGLIDPNIKGSGNTAQQPAQPATGTQPNQPAPNAPAGKPGPQSAAGTQYGRATPPGVGPATKPAAPASPLATPTINQPKTTVTANPNAKSKPGDITKGGVGITTKESQYEKLNAVFESIISEADPAKLMRISDFLMNWFTQYMQGVNWQASKNLIHEKLVKLENDYPKNVKGHLDELGRIALALSKAGHTAPAGAPQEFAQDQKNAENLAAKVKTDLEALAKEDPAAYNELIKTLKPTT